MSIEKFKRVVFKIYCWYKFFDKGNFSVHPWSTLVLIGLSIVTAFILLLWSFLMFNIPSRDVYYSFYTGKLLMTVFIIVAFAIPLLTGLFLMVSGYNKKIAQTELYKQCEEEVEERLYKKPVIIRIIVLLLLFLLPYFTSIIMDAFFELFIFS